MQKSRQRTYGTIVKSATMETKLLSVLFQNKFLTVQKETDVVCELLFDIKKITLLDSKHHEHALKQKK